VNEDRPGTKSQPPKSIGLRTIGNSIAAAGMGCASAWLLTAAATTGDTFCIAAGCLFGLAAAGCAMDA